MFLKILLGSRKNVLVGVVGLFYMFPYLKILT